MADESALRVLCPISRLWACLLVSLGVFFGCSDVSPTSPQETVSNADLDMDSSATSDLPLDITSHCLGNTLDITNLVFPSRGQSANGLQGVISVKSPCLASAGHNYLELAGDPRGWIILESDNGYVELLSLIEIYLLDSTADLSTLEFTWSKWIEHLLPNIPGSEMRLRYGCLDSTHSTLPQPHRVEVRWLIVPPVGDYIVRAEFQFSCE
jgi:hypothetical protein